MTKHEYYHTFQKLKIFSWFYSINNFLKTGVNHDAYVRKVTLFFQNFIFKIQKCEKSWKNAPFFSEKAKFQLADARYDFHTFFRHSSEYLQYSVLSPKRFGQKQMKIEQKAWPSPKKSRILGGVKGATKSDLREVCARRHIFFKNAAFSRFCHP